MENLNRAVIVSLLCATTLLLSLQVTGRSKSKNAKIERNQRIENLVMGGYYEIEVMRAVTMKGVGVPLSGDGYSVVIRGDSVESYLPYYGVAYKISYGGGEGLIFSSAIENYRVESTKRKGLKIGFAARTAEDIYTFNILVSPDGSSSITILSMNRQMISFYGNVVDKKREDE